MSDDQDPLIGTLAAGRYRVIKPLGEGGMGQVYLAEHEAIEKHIALKVLHAEYAHKGDIVARFQQEAISASRIKHPNVLDVFDFGQLDNGCFYLAMEFLEGHDLAREIEKSKVLDAFRGLRFALQICRALAAAHSKGVVHRDMKPENVFLQHTGDGEEIVKIVDFGIAQLRNNDEAAASAKQRRLTRTGMIFGTPEYMAPEQAAGKKTDLRSDVYAVGLILYEMFTGAVPFTGESFLEVLQKHVSAPAPPMNVVFPQVAIGPELQAVIMRALEKDPANRYQSMNEFAQAIIATPEGSGMGRPSLVGGIPSELGGYAAVAPGAPTAAQFHNQNTLGPGVQGGATPGGGNHDAAATAHTILASADGSGTNSITSVSAVTQTGTASTVIPTKSNTGLVVALVGGFFALAAAAGWFLVMKGGTAGAEPAAEPTAPPPVVTAPPPVVTQPAPSAETTPTPSAAPVQSAVVSPATGFRLDVVTEPPGATLSKNGFQVCDVTPCEVTAAPNETLELEAKKGALKGTAKVLAQRDQRVTIKLGAAVKPSSGPRMCEVEVDGLKILRPCK